MYYIYGAQGSIATDKAENLLLICKKDHKVFIFGKDYNIVQLQRLIPGTEVVPHIYLDTKYIGGLKELYDHLYSVVKFEDGETNDQ